MQNPSTPNTNRQPKDWQAIVSEWKASGLSKRQFSKERGISDVSLCQAVQRLTAKQGFVKVGIPKAATTIDLPSGIRVTSSSADVVDIVLRLMRGG